MEFKEVENYFKDVVVKEEYTESGPESQELEREILEGSEDTSVGRDDHMVDPLSDDLLMFACRFCEMKFRTPKGLQKHLARHKQGRLYCSICSKSFISDYSLGNHMKNSHECEECGKIYNCRAEVESHLWQIHRNLELKESGSKSLKPKKESMSCHMCGKKFKHRCLLSRHLDDGCKKKEVFKCRHCPQEFSYHKARKNHMMKKHSRKMPYELPSQLQIFTCDICQHDFKEKKQMEEHFRREHGTYICPHCGREFKKLTYYLAHIKTHVEARNLQCRYCSKIYKNSINLDRHMRKYCKGEESTANAGKVYTCPICGWIGTVAREFLIHIRKHNYSIDIPPPVPLEKQIANDELLDDPPEDILSCPHCQESFNQEELLEEHIEKIHKKLLIQLACIKKEEKDILGE